MEKELSQAISMIKIENFYLQCKKFGIPIDFLKKIERSLIYKNGKLFLIGGNVRSLVQKKKIDSNPDLVVNINYKKVKECLKKSKIDYVEVGASFGSLVINYKKTKIDLTSMRSDIETDGRWAKIRFTDSLDKDSKRRDFTFNSIYCDMNGEIHDPNNGLQDLKEKKVKFIGDIKSRIKEDFLRIMRFFRFSLSISGQFNENDLKICNKYLNNLKKLSFERRIDELQKILMNEKVKNIEIFKKLHPLLVNTLESNLNFDNFIKLCKVETIISDLSFHRRLKFLLRSINDLSPLLKKKSSKKLKTRLSKKIFMTGYSSKSLNHMLFHDEKIHIIDKLIFDYVDDLISKKDFYKYLNFVINFKKKKFPLTGEDLKNIGYKPGKNLGDTLDKITSWWITNDFKKNKRSCINYAKELFKSLPRC